MCDCFPQPVGGRHAKKRDALLTVELGTKVPDDARQTAKGTAVRYRLDESDRTLDIDDNGTWHIGPGRTKVVLELGFGQLDLQPGAGQVVVNGGHGQIIVHPSEGQVVLFAGRGQIILDGEKIHDGQE